ncbi:hypothetical protein [uncultured Winogradskyella sp.]|uniref:hypothetical protein n=1 Tax=uncultured Winogradskyella sp. TaxID=395353 RepID=UPI00260DB6DE|nr:hypothetical protein [uncultured Winogradskyella sp.]
MAPIKFEENIKDKLEKRTLSPSSESWSKLSDRLDADEKKSRNPIFWWLSIAAGLIIMIAVSAHFFKSSNTEDTLPKMVNDEPKVEQLEDKTPKLNDTNSLELASEEEIVEDKNESLQSTKEPQILDYKKVTNKKTQSKIQLAENETLNGENNEPKKTEELNMNLQSLTSDAIMKEAVAEALNNLKSENTTVADREIDSLLKLASKELFKEKLQKEPSKTVDANALLLSVEDEMGQSFRSKVFEALTESYETVKTAVADRNN